MSLASCKAALTSPALSGSAWTKLAALSGINWSVLWHLMLQYGGPAVVGILEELLAKLPLDATWQQLLANLIEKLVAQFGAPVN